MHNNYSITVDQAIQNMLFNSSNIDLQTIACLAIKERDSLIRDFQTAYRWTLEECDEFLDNVSLAYELLVNDNPL